MPLLIRRYVKTSFVFLLLGLALGGYITVEVNLRGRGVPWPLVTAHVHLLLVGFMLTLVFGVATWMFPRPARGDERYRPWLAEATYWLLTLSTAVRTLGELGSAAAGSRGDSVLAAVGGLGQVGAALLFVVNMWVRVRMPALAPPVERNRPPPPPAS
ncbi:MAG TPA: cbb3-type cytochrome c oxidase subunit I [Methylomirabilota bacterium]|nr:cbb3-type cytochrome c oxidase subunit I [Methylomirabilota bacterium]